MMVRKVFSRSFDARVWSANVLAAIALGFTVGGGTALAAYAITSSDQIAPNVVTGGHVIDGALTGADVRDNSLDGTDIDESRLGTVPRASTAGVAGTAYGRYHDDALLVPGGAPVGEPAPTAANSLLSLSLPAGSYAIVAKGVLVGGASSSSAVVSCRVIAGGDYDTTVTSTFQGGSSEATLTVLHRSGVPFTAQLACLSNGATGSYTFHYANLTALPMAAVANAAG